MPFILTTGQLNIKDADGQYQKINTLLSENINAAIAQIDAAVDETIRTILPTVTGNIYTAISNAENATTTANSAATAALTAATNATVAQNNFIPFYDEEKTYTTGDYVLYNDNTTIKCYICINDTEGAFNPNDWQETTIGTSITTLIKDGTTTYKTLSAYVETIETIIQNLEGTQSSFSSLINAINAAITTVIAEKNAIMADWNNNLKQDIEQECTTLLNNYTNVYERYNTVIASLEDFLGEYITLETAVTQTVEAKDIAVDAAIRAVDATDAIERKPDLLDEVDGTSDLDIADDDGNIIMRLADGHLQTKNFNSALSSGTVDAETDKPDLDMTDPYGNVLMRLEDGGIETREFRGFRYKTYASETRMYYGTALTLACPMTFRKGDRVVIHCERGAMPWDAGGIVSYYEDNVAIKSNWRGDCAWIEHTIMEDGAQISAAYAANAYGMPNGQVRLEVSLLGDIPIMPKVVTVKQDGSGDFTTLRGALDAIGTKANDVLNPYRIEIYPGTYDVLADYTDEEIAAAVYDQTSFVGPKLLNGMYLIGMGLPGEVVLTASLDPNEWSSSLRGDISTLNCQGSCGFENLTIIAHDLRYCVHDDFNTPVGKKPKRIVKNCVFRGYDVAYTPCTTYGAGTSSSGCDYEFINCDFGDNAGVHTVNGVKNPSYVHLVNCVGHGFRIGDNDTTSPVPFLSEYRFDNCDFLWINQRQPGAAPHVTVTGSGGMSPLYQFTPETLYTTGDVTIIPNVDIQFQGGVGSVVRWYSNSEHGPRWALANGADDARGIVVWQDADNTYVQTKGYVRTDRTGITSFLKGNYVGVINGIAAIVSNADDAFGRIDYVDNTSAGYIKLNWR